MMLNVQLKIKIYYKQKYKPTHIIDQNLVKYIKKWREIISFPWIQPLSRLSLQLQPFSKTVKKRCLIKPRFE